jgi:anti-anti-sigma regulatory factor
VDQHDRRNGRPDPASGRSAPPLRPDPRTAASLTTHSRILPPFRQVVDCRMGAIRAQGHLSRQAADMLRGTVAALRDSGHARIVLDLGDLRSADDLGLHVVRSLQDAVDAGGGHLTGLRVPQDEASRQLEPPASAATRGMQRGPVAGGRCRRTDTGSQWDRPPVVRRNG